MVTTPLVPGTAFTPVSPKYPFYEFVAALLWMTPVAVAGVGAYVLWGDTQRWLAIVAVAGVLLSVWVVAISVRRAHYVGYREEADELLVASGIMWRRVDVVPYGRMQEVAIGSNPLQRMFSLATITMETASVTTEAEIPGLPRGEAERLRLKLTALGASKMEGL